MDFTKITTQTWSPSSSVTPVPGFEDQRAAYLAEQVAAGKTDGVLTEITPLITTRKWVDQESAEAWKSYMESLVAAYFHNNGLTIEVSDL